MHGETWIDAELGKIKEQSLLRKLRAFPAVGGKMRLDDRDILNFSSNDYLGLSAHPSVMERARETLEKYGAGATASRLMSGNLECHEALEERLAELKGYPAALLFGSGYLANAGIMQALVGRGDTVIADKLVHASIIDAILQSRAGLRRFRHNDPEHLEELLAASGGEGRTLVVTESVFSMDGDVAPLSEIALVSEKAGAMLAVDEAHSTGVFGERGCGLVRDLGLQDKVNVSMGTMGKALGSYGGFVAFSESMRQLFINRSRSFVYTTAMPPAVVGAVMGALDVLDAEPARGAELLEKASAFRTQLQDGGLDTADSASQIVPVILGRADDALKMSSLLEEKGIIALAVRPPTVPEGTARLRFSITLAHSDEDLSKTAEVVLQTARKEGVV